MSCVMTAHPVDPLARQPIPLDPAHLEEMRERFRVGNSEAIMATTLSVDSPRTPEPMSPIPQLFQPMGDTRHEDLTIHPSRELEEQWEVSRVIGCGGYGVVREAKCKSSGKLFAIKSITHTHLETTDSHSSEVLFAWRVEHPYLVSLVDCFQDQQYLHLVMELCHGGSLEEKMAALRNQHGEPRGLPGSELMRYTWEMVAGIAYLHHHKIAHRDCKPENYLLDTASATSPLKLIDFGIAVRVRTGQTLTERVGTPGYAAPEVTKGEAYWERCDIWSIGAVSFLLSVGFPAFVGNSPNEVMRKVIDVGPRFDPLRWDLVKPQMRNIIKSMMTQDPYERPSANSLAEEHAKWLTRCKSEDNRLEHQAPCCVIS